MLEQLPKPVNFSGGMEPLTIGGTFTLAEILGTVPVEADGSAYFEVPALRSLFFVALDENDLSVKRMQSFVIAPAGRDDWLRRLPRAAEPAAALQAGRWPPCSGRRSQIEPIAGVPDVLDFPRDIQPILDRHCVECHNPDRCDGRVDLTRRQDRRATRSATETIRDLGLVADGRNLPQGNRAAADHRQLGQPADEADRRQPLRGQALRPRDGRWCGCGSRPAPPTRAPTPRWAAACTPCPFRRRMLRTRCGSCHGHGGHRQARPVS